MLFGSHVTADEAEFIQKSFQYCDIYIPEAIEKGCTLQEEFCNQIAQGDICIDKFARWNPETLPFRIREWEIVSDSKKLIWICDIPYFYTGDDLKCLEKANYVYPGKFESALSELERDIKTYTQAHQLRERYIIQNIRWRLRALIRGDQGIREKEQLKVLMFMGAFHTNVGHQLAKKFMCIRTFQVLPLVYPPVVEVMRRFVFGKRVNQEILAQVFLSEYFGKFFVSLGGRKRIYAYEMVDPMLAWVRKLNISFEEVKSLWSPRAGGIPKERLKKFLLARGWQIPKTTGELKNLFLPQR